MLTFLSFLLIKSSSWLQNIRTHCTLYITLLPCIILLNIKHLAVAQQVQFSFVKCKLFQNKQTNYKGQQKVSPKCISSHLEVLFFMKTFYFKVKALMTVNILLGGSPCFFKKGTILVFHLLFPRRPLKPRMEP